MKVLIILLLFSFNLYAGPTIVGNGDDGTDLEDFQLVKSGRLLETRQMALKKLKSLNIQGIPGLGNLIPEVENTKIYITNKNVSAVRMEELGAFESGPDGLVYARTFARPYAATRFFPAALKLSDTQLIALHIHEALHRALPESVREDEKTVSKITLVIISPNATHDHIKEKTEGLIVKKPRKFLPQRNQGPTTLSLNYYNYQNPDKGREGVFNSLDEMYQLQSTIHPFENKWSTLGFGLDFSFFKAGEDSYMGPLGLSLNLTIFALGSYDLEAYGLWARDTGSSKEFRNSLSARDSFRMGIKLSKHTEDYFIQNSLEFVKQDEAEKTFSGVKYLYDYGSLTSAKVLVLRKHNKWSFGSDLKLILAGDFRVRGENVDISTGRNTVLALGPTVKWKRKRLELSLFSNFILSSSQKTDFNTLGDIMGEGLGQGHIGLGLTYFF